MLQLGYTWSKTIGMGCVNGQKDSPCIQDLRFYKLNRGLASIDRPHNFSAMFVAEPPFGAGKKWATSGIASKLLGGWQASGLLSVVSGKVFRVSASDTSLNAGTGNDQRPDRIMSRVPILGAVGPGSKWFFPGAFAGVTNSPLTANDQRFGTSPFFPLHGPSSFDLDGALFRTIKLTERWSLQFRAQAMNLTNTAHFKTPNGSCGSYGTSSTPGAVVPTCTGGSFGQVSSTWTSEGGRDGVDQRQFELSLKLIF